ncbi:hypothetical protein ABZT49_05970 [Methylobacterium sp. EM32]|uniref:hypothetical protein n=1 Tax=Methylobacterium sp. EM32 TaxID=3163481 RepID=UPI0033B28972
MDPIIVTLAAGATYLLKGITDEVIKDAYQGVKDALAGRLSNIDNIEDDPFDDDYCRAADKELKKKKLDIDPLVLQSTKILNDKLKERPANQLTAAGININQIIAHSDVIIKRLESVGPIVVSQVNSTTGKVDIEGVSTGKVGEKN